MQEMKCAFFCSACDILTYISFAFITVVIIEITFIRNFLFFIFVKLYPVCNKSNLQGLLASDYK
jgi:hypothetical protein